MKLVLHRMRSVKGPIRMPYLAPDAALALLAVEKDTDGLVYTDMWRDPTASLLAMRTRKTSQLPGYSSHNYGISIDIDVKTVLAEKKILYEDLLHIMKKRGWAAQRRDGESDRHDSCHFNYLGSELSFFLDKCTMDPMSWLLPAEYAIYARHGKDFQLEHREAQQCLTKLALYYGPFTGTTDLYLREAILAFQRAWGLTPNGILDATTLRVLAFVTSERELLEIPSWAS